MRNIASKFISALLIIASLLGLCCVASAAEPMPGFSDVPAGAWYEKYCYAVSDTGIMNGTGDKVFSPLTDCTRAMFVTILYRLADSPTVKAESTMTDVVQGSWYANAVAWAQETGVTTGYADGTFGVGDTLNRQQMVTFLHRFAKYMGSDVSKTADISSFADSASVQDWAKEAVSWAVAEGVLQGSDKGLEPDTSCNRAMAATVISRMNGLADEVTTRKMLEDAIVETAWTYYMKGEKIQYCGRVLDEGPVKWWGGTWRQYLYSKVEDATSDFETFSVCSEYLYSVYDNALNYPLAGARVNQMTHGTWYYSGPIENLATLRYATSARNNGKGTFSREDNAWGLTDNSQLSTLEETLAFLKNWKETMRPGDLISYYNFSASNGHNLLYIGNGYILDSRGSSYDMTAGMDKREANGTVYDLTTVEEQFLDLSSSWSIEKLANSGNDGVFVILRPLNPMCIDDGDNDPSNDVLDPNFVLEERDDLKFDPNTKKSGFGVLNSTKTRMQYPAMEIDRTVNISPYGTTFTGDTLTYNVKITNNSNEASYMEFQTAYRGTAYSGEDYKSLTVKETVPAGTELVAVPEGAKFNGQTIIWNVDIPSGKSVDLSYSVKVTAKQGETIVNKGGWVGYIPSNTIRNTVGGAKLSAEKLDALKTFGAAKTTQWNSNDGYKISAKAADTAFAERIYNETAALDLQLPTAQELLDNLFTLTKVGADDGFGSHKHESGYFHMLVLNDNVSADYQIYRDMVIYSYAGGLGVHTDRYAGVERIGSFRTRYMEPGDIVLHANLSGSTKSSAARKIKDYMMIVYLGDGVYASLNNEGEMQRWTNETALWTAHSYDFFVALRPSQAYNDINKDVPAYDKSKTASLADADKNTALELWSQASLFKLMNEGGTLSNWSAAKKPSNSDFARWIYNMAKIDISDKFSQNTAYIVRGIWEDVNGQYRLRAQPDESCVGLREMVVPGAWCGTRGASGDKTKMDSLDDYRVGDIIGMYKKEDVGSCYGIAVYLGNDRFLYANYVPNIANSKTAEFVTLEQLKTSWDQQAWWMTYVLRPGLAYGASLDDEIPADLLASVGSGVSSDSTAVESGNKMLNMDWQVFYTLRPSQAVSGLDMSKHEAALKTLNEGAWSTSKPVNQKTFCPWVYNSLGVDISEYMTQNISYTVGVNQNIGVALFKKDGDKFIKTTEPVAETFAGISKMYVDGMCGGANTTGGDAAKVLALDSYKPGDMMMFMHKTDSYSYGMAVYLGDGKFLTVATNSSGAFKTECKIYTFDQFKLALS